MLQKSIINITPELWKLNRTKPHSLHSMCSRLCSLPPTLTSYCINNFSIPGETVLDSFSGKGTVPLEACLNDRIGVGNDASPEAYVLTSAKVNPLPYERVEAYLYKLGLQMKNLDVPNLNAELDKNAKIFYSNKTFEQIIKLRELLHEDSSQESIFVKGLMCGILHGSNKLTLSLRCSHSFSMSPRYVKKYAREHRLRRPTKDVIKSLMLKAKEVLRDELPIRKGQALEMDARSLRLRDSSVDLIITSPPYFDKATYAWDNWLRLWFLKYHYKEIRKRLVETGSKITYYDFMKDSLSELFRILKEDKYCFIIAGDVKLKNKLVNTAKFISKPAQEIGFELESIVTDNIPQAKKQLIYLKNNQGIKRDRILCLKKE